MNEYEAKKAARIERYQDRAEKAEERATEANKRSRQISDMIPFGQPILIGHHSEKRHRADIKRLHRLADKAVAESDKTNYWANRAESAEKNHSISSDDPEATHKLDLRIAELEKAQNMMKTANKLIKRKVGPDLEGLRALGYKESTIETMIAPDFCGRIGFASYQLTNNNSNIRRLKQRREGLVRNLGRVPASNTYGEIRVDECPDDNRVRMFFPGKPSDEIRTELKREGFKWSRNNGAWQRHLNHFAVNRAKFLAAKFTEAIQ